MLEHTARVVAESGGTDWTNAAIAFGAAFGGAALGAVLAYFLKKKETRDTLTLELQAMLLPELIDAIWSVLANPADANNSRWLRNATQRASGPAYVVRGKVKATMEVAVQTIAGLEMAARHLRTGQAPAPSQPVSALADASAEAVWSVNVECLRRLGRPTQA